jgi:hypothetical protein
MLFQGTIMDSWIKNTKISGLLWLIDIFPFNQKIYFIFIIFSHDTRIDGVLRLHMENLGMAEVIGSTTASHHLLSIFFIKLMKFSILDLVVAIGRVI